MRPSLAVEALPTRRSSAYAPVSFRLQTGSAPKVAFAPPRGLAREVPVLGPLEVVGEGRRAGAWRQEAAHAARAAASARQSGRPRVAAHRASSGTTTAPADSAKALQVLVSRLRRALDVGGRLADTPRRLPPPGRPRRRSTSPVSKSVARTAAACSPRATRPAPGARSRTPSPSGADRRSQTSRPSPSPARGNAAGGTSSRRDGGPDRGRPAARRARAGRGRARDARRAEPGARALTGPADARAVPLRATGRGAPGVSRRAARARRRARDRPGKRLQELEQAILRQDEALDLASPAAAVPRAGATRGRDHRRSRPRARRTVGRARGRLRRARPPLPDQRRERRGQDASCGRLAEPARRTEARAALGTLLEARRSSALLAVDAGSQVPRRGAFPLRSRGRQLASFGSSWTSPPRSSERPPFNPRCSSSTTSTAPTTRRSSCSSSSQVSSPRCTSRSVGTC